MRKRVLALQHVWDDPPGILAEILEEHGIDCEVINAVEEHALPDPSAYQAVVVMGGTQHVYSDEALPYMQREMALLRQALAQDQPILGICLGGQILARTLGAEVSKHHLTELGFFEIPLTEAGKGDPLFRGLGEYELGFHWHEDIFALPAGAVLLAGYPQAPHQAFRYGNNAYGLQFHIELNEEMAHTWLHSAEFAQEMTAILEIEDAPARLQADWSRLAWTYQAHTRIVFENFLRLAQLL